MQKQTLAAIKKTASQCILCKLATTRNNVVFGSGSENAKILIVGEGPGKQEDLQGLPFIGRSGQLLDLAINDGLNLKREDLYIANLVKCRPTVDLLFQKDRPPEPDELASCLPYLYQQIEAIQPSIILSLGAPASKTLSGISKSMTQLRGVIIERPFGLLLCSWHPSYVLRHGGAGSMKYKDLVSDLEKAGSLV